MALHERGQGDEEIAAAYFVTPQIVMQRLKLASVTPALLEVYAEDGITLEQLMAFTVNPDYEPQDQVWDVINSSWNKDPYQIRRMLTEASVRASDRRAVFVGVDVYEAAGGTMLLDRLVAEYLQAEAEAIVGESWKWIEASLDLPYGYSRALRRLSGDSASMTDDEGAAHAKLLAEYLALEGEYVGQDEFPEEIDTRLGELEQAMEKLENRPLIFEQTEIARAGAFVTLDRYGALAVYRGYVRPEDERRDQSTVQDGLDPALAGRGMIWRLRMAAAVMLVQMSGPSLCRVVSPSRLVWQMTRMMARSPDVALTLLLAKLVTDTFQSTGATGGCLEASVRQVCRSPHAANLMDSPVAQAVDERHAAWKADLPLGEDAVLWDYLTNLDQASRLSLLAHCLSFGINALHVKVRP